MTSGGSHVAAGTDLVALDQASRLSRGVPFSCISERRWGLCPRGTGWISPTAFAKIDLTPPVRRCRHPPETDVVRLRSIPTPTKSLPPPPSGRARLDGMRRVGRIFQWAFGVGQPRPNQWRRKTLWTVFQRRSGVRPVFPGSPFLFFPFGPSTAKRTGGEKIGRRSRCPVTRSRYRFQAPTRLIPGNILPLRPRRHIVTRIASREQSTPAKAASLTGSARVKLPVVPTVDPRFEYTAQSPGKCTSSEGRGENVMARQGRAGVTGRKERTAAISPPQAPNPISPDRGRGAWQALRASRVL